MGHSAVSQKLTKEQKQAVGLLSIGTFLEYFDLMLYVHMAVLLNELFFPKYDPHTTQLLTSLAFCSTYLLRPFGALIFGWLGDNIGRKSTVIITTTMMAFSCFVMANLPTYAQVGIIASWIVSICRIVQGMTSMGEIIGAILYLTEITKPPIQYSVVTSIGVFSALGGTAALGVASLFNSHGFNWRMAFLCGSVVALVGTIARTKLRETPNFVDAKKRIENTIIKCGYDIKILDDSIIAKEKVNKISVLALFLIECTWPAWFYLIYMHCGNILKNSFGFTPEAIINQNFIVSMCYLGSITLLSYITYYIHPFLILKIKLLIFSIFILAFPYLLDNITSAFQLLIVQSFFSVFAPTGFPAVSIFYLHFPILKRFTYSCLIYAVSRSIMAVVTSFSLIYLIDYLGNYGLLLFIIPVILGFAFALFHFEKLEKILNRYPLVKSPNHLEAIVLHP